MLLPVCGVLTPLRTAVKRSAMPPLALAGAVVGSVAVCVAGGGDDAVTPFFCASALLRVDSMAAAAVALPPNRAVN